ncbi:hypothetical protein [Treponema sp.]|uniref:hypothetical protein n=1 Tax=Treponema sp. TaxID=166 RepID=UPI0025E5F429|nr:hypothetical protein [Treponema sp.]MCR5217199.1 fibronectin type III domain-containing protein [Treponema sp.]
MKLFKYLAAVLFFVFLFTGCSSDDERTETEVNYSLSLTASCEELTNQDLQIVLVSENQIAQAAWYKGNYSGSGKSIIESSKSTVIEKDGENWAFTVSENGIYSVGAKTSDGNYMKAALTLGNIDKTGPLEPSNLSLKYNGGDTMEVSWTDPLAEDLSDSPVSLIKLCWSLSEGNYSQEYSLDAGSQSFTITGLTLSESDYITLLIYAVDELGNEGNIKSAVRYLKSYSETEKTPGNIITTEGTLTPEAYQAAGRSDAQAVVAFVNESGVPVGMGLNQTDGNVLWCTNESGTYYSSLKENICTPSVSSSSFITEDGSTVSYNSTSYSSTSYSNLTFTGDTDGSDNWDYIKSVDEECTSTSSDIALYYPAFAFIENYSSNEYASGWYMPSIAELCHVTENITAINEGMAACGGDSIGEHWYWSSSQADNSEINVWTLRVISSGDECSQLLSTSSAGSKTITFDYEEAAEGSDMAGDNESTFGTIEINVSTGSLIGDSLELERIGLTTLTDKENPFCEDLGITVTTSVSGAKIYYSLTTRLDDDNYSTDGSLYEETDDKGYPVYIPVTSTCTLWVVVVKSGEVVASNYKVFSKFNRREIYSNGYVIPLRIFN